MGPFEIVVGLPEMDAEITRLRQGFTAGTLGKEEQRLARKLFKAIANLSRNPFHPGLQSHEIASLTARYNKPGGKNKVFASYLENNTPAAGRLFWVYGPARGRITLVGLEPHPEDRKNAGYARVQLSRMPTLAEIAVATNPRRLR